VLSDFWRDVVFGARALRRRPGFAVVVITTIALGIGATTAVFSLTDWLLLRPLPGVTGADRMVTVELDDPNDRAVGLSSLNLADVAAATSGFEHVAGWAIQLVQLMNEERRSVQVFGELVGGDYFGALGVRPVLGRGILPEETRPGSGSFVAVISHDLWRSTFGADPQIVGKAIQANRHSLTIVGVAPAGFRGAERAGRIDIWVPASIAAAMRHMPDPRGLDGRRSAIFFGWGGRLAPGASVESVQAQLAAAVAGLARAYPEENERLAGVRPVILEGVGLSSTARENLRKALRILTGVVALVLIIACANVANMLLFRGVERRGEAAVRRALGATGPRLVRQQLAEGLVLALAGGVLGLVVAFAFKLLFQGTRLQLIELEKVPLDGRVFAFALAASVVTGLLFGLVPTALARGLDLASALKEGGTRQTGRSNWVRSVITVVQLSLSLALLAGALLLTRTLLNYYAIELGFDTRLVSFTLDMQPQGYTAERRRALESALLDRLRAAPEFESAALTVNTPFAGFYGVGRLLHPETADTLQYVAEWISPGYFETLDATILSGRPLGAEDFGAGEGVRNVVVSEALARRLFGSADALGRTFRSTARTAAEMRIVGVAANKRVRTLDADPELVLYEPLDAPSRGAQYVMVVVRTSLPVPRAEAAMREIVDGLDPALPFMYVERLSDKLGRAMAEQRLFARLLVTLASIALVLAAVGLYAVVAYSVAARTREIGIRMALGADRRRVLLLVARQAAILAGAGIALGVVGARWVSRLVESRLFGVEPLDPSVHAAAAALFLVIAIAAAAVPARRATRVDPLVALRHE
jgi:predicted permease